MYCWVQFRAEVFAADRSFNVGDDIPPFVDKIQRDGLGVAEVDRIIQLQLTKLEPVRLG